MEEQDKQVQETESTKKHSKRFLVVYIIGLFSVALVLILLSYLTQVRANKQLASLQDQVTTQTTFAQGAQQQIQQLQTTLEEQQKKLTVQSDAIGIVRRQLAVPENEKMVDAVDLLNARYTALDALQQVRRMVAAQDMTGAKELANKMIEKYSAEKLLPPDGDNEILLGQNALEFRDLCAQLGVDAIYTVAATTTTTNK